MIWFSNSVIIMLAKTGPTYSAQIMYIRSNALFVSRVLGFITPMSLQDTLLTMIGSVNQKAFYNKYNTNKQNRLRKVN